MGAEEGSSVRMREEEEVVRRQVEQVERQELPAGYKLCGAKRKYIETPIEVGKCKSVKIHDKSSLQMLHSKGRFLELTLQHLEVIPHFSSVFLSHKYTPLLGCLNLVSLELTGHG